ncbi:MAG TPA: hypothetical protein VHX52_12730 [Steroidobacteraceae bacterium]|jgi:hypothetical protein|nr:hypothetical protein [Steroidobacteraceae bacterium]
MRKLPLSLLAIGAFAVAYAAGVYSCALATRRRVRRPVRPHGLDAADEPRAHYELAADWARQGMFGSG